MLDWLSEAAFRSSRTQPDDGTHTAAGTKIQMPQVTAGLVVRPCLSARLNEGLGHPLTLVCAAAGFGKSTPVSSWLGKLADAGADAAIPAAWLALDESDSDLTEFLGYMTEALRAIFPGACANTLELLLAQNEDSRWNARACIGLIERANLFTIPPTIVESGTDITTCSAKRCTRDCWTNWDPPR